MELFIDFEID